MIYLSAGHNKKLMGADPGAIGIDGVKEADLTVELRDLIVKELGYQKASVITDKDSESLGEYLGRIKPGSGSVVCELHFNCSERLATGTEVIVKNDPNEDEVKLANAICSAVSSTCAIPGDKLYNRGVKTEAKSHRGRLGILHTKAGISILIEVCFINNPNDLRLYHLNKLQLAKKIAGLLVEYDGKYS